MNEDVLIIDGVDITPYIEKGGVKWQLSDIDSENTGRTMDGTMQRSRVASKVRLDVTCLPLDSDGARTVLNAIYPVFISVQYLDPMYGLTTKTMYSNNRPAALRYVEDGKAYWEGISFPLIER